MYKQRKNYSCKKQEKQRESMEEFKPSLCLSHLPGGVQEEKEDGWQNQVIAAYRPAPAEHDNPWHG